MKFSFSKKTQPEGGVRNPPPLVSSGAQSKIAVPPEKTLPVAKKKRTFRSSSGAKFGLIIGDDGAILIYMVGNVVKSRHFVVDAGTQNLKEFENVLAQNPKAPLYMIIDSMDQTFVQQTLPPISAMSVNKLIRRRLDRDLPADTIKGSILLEREKSGRKDWNFLMVSLEKSPQLTVWMEFVERIPNRLKGIYLLSVEVENILKHVDRALGIAKEGTGSRWKFFVSHNKVGGFRQVILKGGRIIFTRLSQPVGEATAEVIAGNIEQEMLSTIEYMKRLSYNPSEGLDVYVVASEDIRKTLDTAKLSASNVYSMTPYEVAGHLGIDGATQPSDQFGDVILTAGISAGRQHVLTLTTPLSKKVEQVYGIIQIQRLFAAILLLSMLGYIGVLATNIVTNYFNIEELTQKKRVQQAAYDSLQAEITEQQFDVKKINEIVDLYKQLKTETYTPLPIFLRLSEAIKHPIRLKNIQWSVDAPAAGMSGEPQMTMTFIVRFPDIISTQEEFKTISKKVMTDLKKYFPEATIEYTALPSEFTAKETQDITFDDRPVMAKAEVKKSIEATVKLTGSTVLKPLPVEAAPQAIVNTPKIGEVP